MQKFKFSIILLIISIVTLNAQKNSDAETLINNLLSSLRTSPFRTEFALSISQKNEVISQAMTGKFTMQGKKFQIDSEIVKVWYDGKTQWGLNEQANEVSITEPTEKELIETNPLTILAAYKSKCSTRWSKIKSTRYHIIELVPKTKNNDFVLIEVKIEKTTGNPYSIAVNDKNGTVSLLTLKNYQKGIKVAENDFAFNKSKFKDITINDLR